MNEDIRRQMNALDRIALGDRQEPKDQQLRLWKTHPFDFEGYPIREEELYLWGTRAQAQKYCYAKDLEEPTYFSDNQGDMDVDLSTYKSRMESE